MNLLKKEGYVGVINELIESAIVDFFKHSMDCKTSMNVQTDPTRRFIEMQLIDLGIMKTWPIS